MRQHEMRPGPAHRCPVCHAPADVPCVFAVGYGDPAPESPEDVHKDDEQLGVAWLEFSLLCAVHNLKEVDPNHPLVRAVDFALQVTHSDVPAFLRKQAD